MTKPVDLKSGVDDDFSPPTIGVTEKQWVDALSMARILCGAGFAINQQLHLMMAEVPPLALAMTVFRSKVH